MHTEWDGTYGRPRTTAELRDDGERVNHKRVGRVMRKYGIAGLRLRKRQVSTVPEPSATPVPDLFRRDSPRARRTPSTSATAWTCRSATETSFIWRR